MNDLRPTLQNYYPEGSIGPGVGDLRGQCAVFAQFFVGIPQVGNTIGTKKIAVNNHGILRKNIKEFLVGDVLIFDIPGVSEGHVAVLTSTDQKRINLSDCNFNRDQRVHHNRFILASSPQIYGVLRGPLKVQLIDPPLKKTFMAITVVANKNNWATLQTQLDKLKQWFIQYSGDRFEPVFNIIKTQFDNIPFTPLNNQLAVDVNWYRTNITPLATGQATLLLINPNQWLANGTFGTMTWGDPKRPVRIEVMGLENEGEVFINRAFHEICHCLLFLTGQKDEYQENGVDKFVVHDLLYQDPPQYKAILDYVDQKRLQNKLITITP